MDLHDFGELEISSLLAYVDPDDDHLNELARDDNLAQPGKRPGTPPPWALARSVPASPCAQQGTHDMSSPSFQTKVVASSSDHLLKSTNLDVDSEHADSSKLVRLFSNLLGKRSLERRR